MSWIIIQICMFNDVGLTPKVTVVRLAWLIDVVRSTRII
jgi:hypothetical protein